MGLAWACLLDLFIIITVASWEGGGGGISCKMFICLGVETFIHSLIE